MPSYRLLADIVLVFHFAIVLFVIAGLLLTIIGLVCRWRWVRNFWFRAVHLAAITIVVLQAWFGVTCSLTTLEMDLRQKAGEQAYEGGFVAHWVSRLLYYEAEPWVFTLGYSLFGAAVLATFIFGRPRWPGAKWDRRLARR